MDPTAASLAGEFVTVTAYELNVYMLFPNEMNEVAQSYKDRADEKDLLLAFKKLADTVPRSMS